MADLVRSTGIVLVFLGLLIAPVMAGTLYMSGSPELSANISGINEFSPGTEAQLTVVIKNTGTDEQKFEQSQLLDSDDRPTTAKYLTASLSPGLAPLTVKSDSQMLGDLKSASSTKAVFITKIDTDATGGTFTLPLLLNYSYLDTTDHRDTTTVEYTYKTRNITLNVPITIQSGVIVDVISAEPEHLNAGTEGYINLSIKNTGSETGTKSIVKLIRNGNSPIIPSDSSVYIGDFAPGSTIMCQYKVSVSNDAEKQTYPVDVVITYQNAEGDFVTSRSDTAGIPVSGKADFTIISSPVEMHPGNRMTIPVEYKNTGDTAIYSAQARISAVDPFTGDVDIAYIGNLQPNESRVVSYEISVDRSATKKQYGLDSEIRYRDALDTTHISETMKVNVNVTAQSGIAIILTNPIYLSILAAVIIGLIYIVYTYRKKQ